MTFRKMVTGRGKISLLKKMPKSLKEDREKLVSIKNKLLSIREKRPKPFFDDKTQIDLNAYWVSTLIFAS